MRYLKKSFYCIILGIIILGCQKGKHVEPQMPQTEVEKFRLAAEKEQVQLKKSELLKQFLKEEEEREKLERTKRKHYYISAGDKLEISVWGFPDLTKEVVVRPDGYISYILVGDIQAEGKTISKLTNEIQKRLSKYIRHPKVTIIGRYFTSKQSSASILGAVAAPGLYTLSEGTHLLDFLAMAKGLKYNTLGQPVYNLKMSYLSRNGKVVPVDFSALLEQGDMSQNIEMKSGDFIYIASSQARSAFVVGAVKMPCKVRFDVEITLLDAIATAGGLADGARPNPLYVVRDSLLKPTVIKKNFYDIIKGKEKNIYLKPGDIVYVPRSALSKIAELPNKVIPFLNLILQSNAVYNVLTQ